MQVFLDCRNRNDPVMSILQMASSFFRVDRSCFQHDDTGDDLQTVGDTMFQLLQKYLFLTYQIILFVLEDAFVSSVLNANQDRGV
jgi:hypothetical protein